MRTHVVDLDGTTRDTFRMLCGRSRRVDARAGIRWVWPVSAPFDPAGRYCRACSRVFQKLDGNGRNGVA